MNSGIFEKAEWIWSDASNGKNEYAEFYDYVPYHGEKAVLRISVCGDYTVFINGKYVASNQYADFSHYKVYDELDVSDFLTNGNNIICFLVWYFGESGMRYHTKHPGLIYEVTLDNQLSIYSSTETVSRKSRAYESGSEKKITNQLGYSFLYHAAKEDKWLQGNGVGFEHSYQVAQKGEFYVRPIKKHLIGELVCGTITKHGNKYLVDLGKEVVGLLKFSLNCEQEANILFSYGELLKNGHVKRKLGHRDFSVSYVARNGKNEYCNYMLRLACRYIEIESDVPIDIEYVGILPQVYPVQEKNITLTDGLDKKIYDMCVNTLKLCMMEHYVDCPWREQCLYAFDSRNQMLCGYYAFEGGNFGYAKANLRLMSKDKRWDNLLSICFPSAENLTIPSFSLYYILSVKEYMEHSGDAEFCREVFDKLTSILGAFVGNIEKETVCGFAGKEHWRFYDWSPYAFSDIGDEVRQSDFLLNCLVMIALQAYAYICEKLHEKNPYQGTNEILAQAVRRRYCNRETGLFFVTEEHEEPTELANSLAILSGVAQGQEAEKICEKLCSGELIPCSLSMKCFKYDAMLRVNKKRYRQDVLTEIRQLYKIMLDADSTTAWETIEGAEAFDSAGSLCHGWSAVPILYYHRLLL